MKIYYLALALCVMMTSCGVMGDIAFDTTDMDGVRTVLSTNKRFMSDNNIALGCRINKADTVAALLLTSEKDANRGIFSKGDRFRVEFADGTQITLKNIYDKEFNTEVTQTETTRVIDEQVGYNYVYSPYTDRVYISPRYFTAFVPERHTYTSTLSYALYPVNYKQLVDMMTKPAVRVGIESEAGYETMSDPSKLPSVISAVYNKLLNANNK